MTAAISLEEANRVLEAAYPKQGVTVKQPIALGAYKVIKANGEVIGSAFDLRQACQQAVRPALEVEAKRRLAESEAKTKDFILFQQFLRERFTDEFNAFKARVADQSSEPSRAEPDSPRLVSLLP